MNIYYRYPAICSYLASVLILAALLAVTSSVVAAEDITIGQLHTIHSNTLNEDRTVAVYLPYGYDENVNDRYPVLYLLGGTNTALLMHAASTMESLDETGDMPQMIIVAIDNPNAPRDCMPVPLDRLPGSGHSDKFQAFLTNELAPWIDSQYRTASYRVLCGASNTGLFTIYSLFVHPGSFSAYLAASPAIGWTPEYVFEIAKTALSADKPLNTSLYMNYGSDDMQSIVLSIMPQFVDTMRAYGRDGFRWKNEVIENGGHVPYVSLYNGLRFIFDGWRYPRETAKEHGLDGVRKHYANLAARFGFDVKIPAGVLMNLGTDYIRSQEFNQARIVFEAYLESYPNSARAAYLVGECHRRTANDSLAAEYYRKALELDSTFTMAQRRLEGLNSERLTNDQNQPPES